MPDDDETLAIGMISTSDVVHAMSAHQSEDDGADAGEPADAAEDGE